MLSGPSCASVLCGETEVELGPFPQSPPQYFFPILCTLTAKPRPQLLRLNQIDLLHSRMDMELENQEDQEENQDSPHSSFGTEPDPSPIGTPRCLT